MRRPQTLCLFLLTACGFTTASPTDAGDQTPAPMWVASLGPYYLDGFDFRVLCFDGRGRVSGLPKNGASSVLWDEGHRIDTSTLTGDAITLVSYLDADDRMAGFLASSANAAIFVKDGRGLRKWFSPPPGGGLYPIALSDDDHILAQGYQSGGFDNGFLAIVTWPWSAGTALPESTRVGTLYKSQRLIWANKRFDYVTHDVSNVDVIPNGFTLGGAAVGLTTGSFSPLAVLDDGAAWGTFVRDDGPHAARYFDGGVSVIEAASTLLAASPGGDALYEATSQVWRRTRDGRKQPLEVPYHLGFKYWLNDQGRVLLQDLDGNVWLYTPRSLPNPVGTTDLTPSDIQVTGLEPSAWQVTSASATSTTRGFTLALYAAPANAPARVLQLQALINRAPVQGDVWTVGTHTFGTHVEQLILGVTEGPSARVFLATGGTVELVSLMGHVAKLKLNAVTFVQVDQPAFTLTGTIEVHSVND